MSLISDTQTLDGATAVASTPHPHGASNGRDGSAGPDGQPRPPRRGRRLLALVALVAMMALAVGCSTGPGTRAEFVEVLTRGGSLSDDEATCISNAVFDRYGDDEDALKKISAAPDFAYLSTEEGVDGFAEFFDTTVAGCSTIGPTTG